MGYHEGLGVSGMLAIVFFLSLIFLLTTYIMYDKLELHITVSQQQTVDNLQNSLNSCRDLNSKLSEQNKAICTCNCPSDAWALYGGFILGGLAVIVVQIVGKWMFKIGRDYEIKRKEKKENKK